MTGGGRPVGMRVVAAVIVVLLVRTSPVPEHSGAVDSPVLQAIGVVLFVAGLTATIRARVG